MPASDRPRDEHGCDMSGWSRAGAHLRVSVSRVYRTEHGSCHFCGQPLSQFQECEECGVDPLSD